MPRYRFEELVYNITEKGMPAPGDENWFIGLEHLDSGSLSVTRWGGDVELTGQKLVMKKGDILFGRRNTYLRRVAIAPHDGYFSAHGMIFRAKEERILSEYLPFFIASDYFMDAAIRISVGSLSPTVNWKTLKELEFEIPEIEEQRKSAALLWAAEDTKRAYEELLKQSDELVKSQFIELFDSSENGAEFIRLEDCCKSITGGNTPSMKHPEYYGGSIPFIKSGDVKTRTIREGALWLTDTALEQTNAKLLPPKTVIVVIRSAALRHEFHTAVTEVPVVINQDLKALTPHDIFLPEYLMWALIAHENDLLGGVQTVLTSHIEMRDLLNLPIKVAPLEQQRYFCDMAAQLDKSK